MRLVRRKGAGAVCSLKAATVASEKSSMACRVSFQALFDSETAQNPQNDTFSVTVSKGTCGYTNTYVMSPTGMVQTKTSPAKARPMCETFPPKVYHAAADDSSPSAFVGVPIGDCKTLTVGVD